MRGEIPHIPMSNIAAKGLVLIGFKV